MADQVLRRQRRHAESDLRVQRQRQRRSSRTASTAATPPRAERPARPPATRSGSSTPTARSTSTTPAAALLGSWTAGTLASNATVEGIATNGTDVWIVDAKSDKVYKYTGAASSPLGSQNAASSFSLNSGNTSPKDIVTDGRQPVGRQRLHHRQGVQVHAVGLAGRKLDDQRRRRPARRASRSIRRNVSNLWIVDSGTDRVYQYDGAASRTSGSQAPSAVSPWPPATPTRKASPTRRRPDRSGSLRR